jgi:hypothetical protein
MLASCIVVKFTRRSLGELHVALMAHAERLNSLLKPSWLDAEEVHEEMYALVDTLMVHGVDQNGLALSPKLRGRRRWRQLRRFVR